MAPGVEWMRVADDGSVFRQQSMESVTAGGPGLVAVGVDWSGDDLVAVVWISTDGRIWSRVMDDKAVLGGPWDQEMEAVTAGGPGLVAVGSTGSADGYADAAVWTSTDGRVWSRVPHDETVFGGPGGHQVMKAVTAGGPGLVAVGRDGSGGDDAAAVWISTDGRVWSRVPHDETVFGGPGGHQVMMAVTAGGPGLVAVGSDRSGGDEAAAVWISTDGRVWSRVPHDETVFGGPGGRAMYSVTAGGPGVVAAGWDGSDNGAGAAVWASTDGRVWSRVVDNMGVLGGPHSRAGIHSVMADSVGLVAVGWDGDGAAVWKSTDGRVWSRVPHDETVFGGPGNQTMLSVSAGGPGLVAVGRDEPRDVTSVDWLDLDADAAVDAAVWVSPRVR